jgi:16S rRNA (uracil1498-N3)-methyltransferase
VARAVAHVFVDDLRQPRLREQDLHHLARALRLRPGEEVTLSDGQGGSLAGEWTGTGVAPLTGAGPSREPPPQPVLTVGFALVKGDRPEWAVQKLTEAGVDRIVVMTSARCVARWSAEAAPRHMDKLREVARQAAMQSRRTWLPSVQGPVGLADLVKGAEGAALAVPGGSPLTLATPTVLVGPEGGWESAELLLATEQVGLGPCVLRAETAALAAGVLLSALRAGLVAPAPGKTAPGAGPQPDDVSTGPGAPSPTRSCRSTRT